MKKVILLCIVMIIVVTACTNKSEPQDIQKEGFYKFELLSSYDECIKILESNTWEYEVNERHDQNGNGVMVTVDNIMSIEGKMLKLYLAFPDTIKVDDKFIDFNSRALVNFSYSIKNIDTDYVQSFIKYCNKYFGEPKWNQFEDESIQDIDPGLVSWDDNNYNIICIAHLGKDDINFVRVQFSMTENHAKIAKKKFK